MYLFQNHKFGFQSRNMLLVAENIPNSGRATIIIPNTVSNTARLIIKARGKYLLHKHFDQLKDQHPNFPTFFTDVENSVQTCFTWTSPIYHTSVGFNDFDIPIHCRSIGWTTGRRSIGFEKWKWFGEKIIPLTMIQPNQRWQHVFYYGKDIIAGLIHSSATSHFLPKGQI